MITLKWSQFKRIVCVLTIIVGFYFIYNTNEPNNNFELANYYLSNTLQETGSSNAVNAVYLDYRLYDSLFESLLLLIAALGIHYLNKGDDYEV